jgi:nucleotide-binding universal stress UspA family protein
MKPEAPDAPADTREGMRILVATDGSRGSRAALNFAVRLAAREEGSELIVLSVDPDADSPAEPSSDKSRRGGATDRERNHAQKILEGAERELAVRGAQARFRVITARGRDKVPEAISKEANRIQADLVVVGSEGRDTLNEWVLGGTALRLIYVAQRPVTVVRPTRRRKAN